VTLHVAQGFQKTAGAVYLPEAVGLRDVNTLLLATIAIKSTAGIAIPSAASKAVTPLAATNAINTAWCDGASQVDPSTDTLNITTLDYNTYSYTPAAHVALGSSGLASIDGRDGGGTYTLGTGGETAQQTTWALKNAQDLTGKLITCSYNIIEDTAVTSQAPYLLGLRSNSAAAMRRFIGPAQDASPSPLNAIATVVYDPNTTDYLADDDGTYDATDVDGVYMAVHRGAAGGSSVNMRWGAVYALETIVITNGSATFPCTFNTFADVAKTSGVGTVLEQNGLVKGQVAAMHNLQIGDGSGATYFVGGGGQLGFATGANLSINELYSQVGENVYNLGIYGVSGDTINLDSSVVAFATNAKGNIAYNASSTSAATWSHSGAIFQNPYSVTLRDLGAGAYGGLTINSCELEITHNDADLTGGVTINNQVSTTAITITGATEAALQTAINNLAGVKFTNSSTYGLTISYTGTGDISLNAPTGIAVDELLYTATASSGLTLVVGSSGAVFSNTSIAGSATSVTISNDKTFTINVNVTGAEITVLQTGTTTEAYHVETGSTTQGYTFVAPLGYNVDVQVFKAGYERFWTENLDLGSADSSISVELVAVPAYEA
jgi:hypothetical protein